MEHRHAAFYPPALRSGTRAPYSWIDEYFWIDEKDEMIAVWTVHGIAEPGC
jgi:hypothetical protein